MSNEYRYGEDSGKDWICEECGAGINHYGYCEECCTHDMATCPHEQTTKGTMEEDRVCTGCKIMILADGTVGELCRMCSKKYMVKLKKGSKELKVEGVPGEDMDVLWYIVEKIPFSELEDLVKEHKKRAESAVRE